MKPMFACRIASITVGIVVLALPPSATAQLPDSDVVFIIDGSGSIMEDEWPVQLEGIRNCICGPSPIIPQDGSVALTVIQFYASYTVHIPGNPGNPGNRGEPRGTGDSHL